MKIVHKSLLFIAMLLIGSLACSAVSGLLATPTPIPTFTPAVPPTSTPSPSLFEESEFGSSSCFGESSGDQVDRFSQDGQFHMVIKAKEIIAWTICEENQYTDFILEGDVTHVEGAENNSFGLVFRYDPTKEEFYSLEVSADGYYTVTHDGFNFTEATYLAEWAQTPLIHTGQTTNHLKVEVIGGNIKYYINDTLVGEVNDSALSSGYIGVIAGGFEEEDTHIAFDNIVVSEP